MDPREHFELNDEELDNVIGGVSIGDQVVVDTKMVCYCPQCGQLITSFTGTVVDKMYYEKGGYYFLDVKANCCGYIQRTTDYVCTLK